MDSMLFIDVPGSIDRAQVKEFQALGNTELKMTLA